ncbi:MAG: hypothetical protein ACYTHJ_15660, partial [Planctomycetota bacterium]
MTNIAPKFRNHKLATPRDIALILVGTIGAIIWLVWSLGTIQHEHHEERHFNHQMVQLKSQLVVYNEALYGAAIMAAYTGDSTWENRYRDYEERFDEAIAAIGGLCAQQATRQFDAELFKNNSRRWQAGNAIFAHVRQGRVDEAKRIAHSDEYQDQARSTDYDLENFVATDDQILQLQQLSHTIVRLDEALTMSARLAALSGEPRWETRYRKLEPILARAVKDAVSLATQ